MSSRVVRGIHSAVLLLGLAVASTGEPAHAAVQLDFNLSQCGAPQFAPVGDFYAGGHDCAGLQGPDYGIDFTGGYVFPDPGGGQSLVFEQGIFASPAFIDVADGFSGGISFRLSSDSLGVSVLATIRDGDDVLATGLFHSPLYSPDPVWEWHSLAFDGHATSLWLESTQEITAVLDDLTLGSAAVVPVPAALWLFGPACLVLLGREAFGIALTAGVP